MRWLIAVAAPALLAVGCSGSGSESGASGGSGGDGAKCAAAPQGWKPISNDGAPSGVVQPSWTGSEVLAERYLGDDDALYDPCKDSWRLRADPPVQPYQVPTKRIEMDGGFEYYSLDSAAPELLGYDFVANEWTIHSTAGAPTAILPAMVSTGDELVVWSGSRERPAPNLGSYEDVSDGAVFDRAKNLWRPMSTDGAPTPRTAAPAVWTGKYVAFWGGMVGKTVPSLMNGSDNCWDFPGGDCERLGDGALYDPALNQWHPIANEGAPSPRSDHVLAWTGSRLLVWGGAMYAAPGASDPQYTPLGDGALYDPSSSTWAAMAPFPGTPSMISDVPFFVQGRLVVFEDGVIDGHFYDPNANAWTAIAAPPVELHCATQWLHAQAGMITAVCNDEAVAARYDVATNQWLVNDLPPSTATGRAVLWTGQRLFVLGGQIMGPLTGCGPNSPPGCDPYPTTTPVNDGAMLIP
jgi:hypothetical protein